MEGGRGCYVHRELLVAPYATSETDNKAGIKCQKWTHARRQMIAELGPYAMAGSTGHRISDSDLVEIEDRTRIRSGPYAMSEPDVVQHRSPPVPDITQHASRPIADFTPYAASVPDIA
eukprot:1641123-Rhodomonas_salina.4